MKPDICTFQHFYLFKIEYWRLFDKWYDFNDMKRYKREQVNQIYLICQLALNLS